MSLINFSFKVVVFIIITTFTVTTCILKPSPEETVEANVVITVDTGTNLVQLPRGQILSIRFTR